MRSDPARGQTSTHSQGAPPSDRQIKMSLRLGVLTPNAQRAVTCLNRIRSFAFLFLPSANGTVRID
jgi:hypothetical protein